MGFLQFPVRRAVAVFCLMLAITGLGINSYRKLALEELPKTDMPYITVVTVYPGASPGEIETDVARQVEDAVGSIDGLKSIRSACMENVCQTLLEFNVGIDVDRAANDVREKLDLIVNDFPEGVEKPRVLKFDINAQPIANFAITGSLPLDALFDYADNECRDQLATIKGVADISLTGGSQREVQVLLDRNRLAAKGLTSMDVVNMLRREIRMIPVGRIRQQGIEYAIKFDAEVSEISELEKLEIANSKGQRCYLRDIGSVLMGSEELRQSASVDGRPAIAVRIIKKADANAVDVVDRVRQKIEQLKQELPGGIELIWVSDTGNYIQASVDSAVSNIWQGIVLTAVLMFFFLYNLKSTLIVAITMPITVIASIFMISLLGYSLNTVTLLALGLSIGILVTNSIVVLESITVELKTADDSKTAAIKGTENIFAAVIASAGTNIVVLFPISMMSGQIGQFFIPFAITMVGITAISLFVSFTLTPAISGQILKREESKSGFLARIEAGWNRGFARFTTLTTSFIETLLHNRFYSYVCVGISTLLLIHALWLVPRLGFSFLPISDRGEIIVKLELPTSFSLERTIAEVKEIEKRLADLPHLKHSLITAGKIDGNIGQTSEGVYLAQILCVFNDKTERNTSIFELRDMVSARLSQIPDTLVTISLPDQVGAGAEIKLVICGNDFAVLDDVTNRLVEQTSKASWIRDVDSSVRPGKNELRIMPRRAVLSDVKVPASYLGMALRTNIEGSYAASYKKAGRTYDIRVKMLEQQGVAQIAGLQFPGLPGYPVILENFVDINRQQSPILISRHNKMRSTMFYANSSPGMPLGSAADRLLQLLEDSLPAGYSAEFIGKIQVMREGVADFIEVGIIAFILTYLLLAAILNSFSQPLIILLTIPLGLIGCVWALSLSGEPISMMILLGGVMLIGIVVNNAILIMDKVAFFRAQGKLPSQAMKAAITHELRAITMITLAAVFGMLPIALDSGLGSELRRGIGLAAVGGILVSAIFTMLLLPVFYCLANPDS